MADIDTISKYLIQHYPDHFARFALARDDIEVIEVIDTEQPTVKARRSDSFIRVRIDNKEALIHQEFQTTDSTNPPMPRRMAGYIGRAIEHHGLPIYSNVIYLRPNAERSGVLRSGASRLPNRDSISRDQTDRDRRPTHPGHGAFGSNPFHAIDEATRRDGLGGVVVSVFPHRPGATNGSASQGRFSRWYVIIKRVGVRARNHFKNHLKGGHHEHLARIIVCTIP